MPPSELDDAFVRHVGGRIAAARKARGLTQERLAEVLHNQTNNVQRMEAGQQNLTLRTLSRVARALGVDPEDLVGRGAIPSHEAPLLEVAEPTSTDRVRKRAKKR